ncbi:MAG: endo,4-beta-xylanase, partial [Solirubrobacterales bacterium]|nr:endo,4-beta-xylanase [Solirubrobacterales bacterium]
LPRGPVVPGVAVRADRLGDAGYAAAAGRLFASVTPENEMKWQSTEPAPGQFSFAAGDRIVAFAREHDLRVRGHALVWHLQLPPWVTGTLTEMRRHIEGVVSHYRGKVADWDVVNEALGDAGGLRDTPFERTIGPGYIARAFVIAHAADPGARLAYNDYGAESPDSPKGRALYRLIQVLVAQRVPIDVVGFQTHADPQRIAGFARQLRRIAALGVDVELTEVDVKLRADATQADLDAQAVAYRRIVGACRAVPRCRGITFWGLDDGDSWIPEFFPGTGHALLLDDQLRPKPAYTAVRDALLRG